MQELKLKPAVSDELRQVHGKLKGVHEFLEGALEALGEDGTRTVVDALTALVPWVGAAVDATADSLPPVKFLLKLFEGLTEVHDPNELGSLACTLAFQRAVEQAIPEVLGLNPPRRGPVKRALGRRMAASYDFTSLTWESVLQHPFIRDASGALEDFGESLGFEGSWNVRLQREVQARFVINLKGILSHGKTRERFAPFAERLELGSSESQLRRALLDHADTQRWQFEERPVLGAEPFSLAQVYIPSECTVLAWDVLGKQRQSPFDPQLQRTALHDEVLRALADPNYRELLLVQGPAGSGKSSFTLALAAHLVRAGMAPLRVELKHLDSRPDLPLLDALARALERNDLGRFPGAARFLPQSGDYERDFGKLFDQEVAFHGLSVCPYVLILDGLDELPLSGNHNYLERLRQLLRDVKETFLRRREPAFPVRVVLAGRPSDFLEQAGVLSPDTRVLTVQPWSANELEKFIAAIQLAQARERAVPRRGMLPGASWRLPPDATLKTLVERVRAAGTDALEVLSSPLIVHLCLRLLGERAAAPTGTETERESPEELLSDATSLYRNLVDLVIAKAGKPPEAEFRPSDGAMIHGNDLRWLLQKTAEVMTVLGVENVAHDELLLGLDLSEAQLEERIRRLDQKELISRLMISFFFKGGHQALGCEFSHKSFREYLFAEAVVEALKSYARETNVTPDERPAAEYWKDFREDDPRFAFSRRLAQLLGPQWLTAEVAQHVRSLLVWEVEQARHNSFAKSGCTLEQWARIRDGLADLWDWWGEGAHIRPQPQRRPRTQDYDWASPYALEVAREARFHATKDIRPPPIRLITVDAHLGEALCLLNVVLHEALLSESAAEPSVNEPPAPSAPRRYQANCARGVAFAPGGTECRYFRFYMHRIGAAGYRPNGEFPRDAYLVATNLGGANLDGVNLSGTNLEGADLSHVSLDGANLDSANLSRANLSEAYLDGANLTDANLSRANLTDANLAWARLSGAYLHSADLNGANLSGADLTGTNLTGSNLEGADLSGVNLRGADLPGANLHNSDLSDADLAGADLLGADLSGANIDASALSQEQLASCKHPP